MIENCNCVTERLTNGPKHHLFGFHDLIISNRANNKYLCMEADTINRPPLPGELFGVGFIEDEHFIKLGTTTALNYPQGSRQQWLSNTDFFTVNNKYGDVWGTDLYDASTQKLVDRYPATTHVLTKDGKVSLGLDYARLFRLGGYGYIGIEDKNGGNTVPDDSGITIMDMKTKDVRQLVSLKQVVAYGLVNNSFQKYHYLTHLSLNPSSSRLAFLHRFFMPDGGQMTRLFTIGVDGSDLRMLGQGFLSHFDWKDDHTIYIYGRTGNAMDSLRNNPLMANLFVKSIVRVGKKFAKSIIGKDKSLVPGSNFLMITDEDSPNVTPFAHNSILSDGHPMTNPIDRDWFICDTYPDAEGYRDLFLYQFSMDRRINLGRFRKLSMAPNMDDKELFLKGIEFDILNTITLERFAFTRSGLHCDLHPRWSSDGKYAIFDSIHEGSRQIYRIDVSGIVNVCPYKN